MSSTVAEPALPALTVLAHAGEAPATAMIALPLVLLGVFFYLEKRARAREKKQEE